MRQITQRQGKKKERKKEKESSKKGDLELGAPSRTMP